MHDYGLCRLGTHYGGWWVDLGRLTSESTVYSVGVGEDISFDLALIAHVGCRVHAFDPTPRAVEWVAKQKVPDLFVFHPIGIGILNESFAFYPPKRKDHVSHSVVPGPEHDRGSPVMLPCRRLLTVAGELGHIEGGLDLLKLDVEGVEDAVIADIVLNGPEVRQLAVEIHPGVNSVAVGAILCRRGFACYHQEGLNSLWINEARDAKRVDCRG